MEKWKEVIGYEGAYSVSNQGRLRSEDRVLNGVVGKGGSTCNRRVKGRIIAPQDKGNGYVGYAMSLLGITRYTSGHRLVAIHFVTGRTNDRDCVNHIDSDRANNHYTNLEWCNHSENANHSIRVGSRKTITDGVPIATIGKILALYIGTKESVSTIASSVGVDSRVVQSVITSQRYGFGPFHVRGDATSGKIPPAYSHNCLLPSCDTGS